MLLTVALIALFFREEFWTRDRLPREELEVAYNLPLVLKSVVVTLLMVVFFFLGQPAAKVAILAGALLLLTRRLKAEKVYREIDWSLLLMFCGLFIVVSGLEHAVLTPEILGRVRALHLENTAALTGITAVLSNIVSNVPAVLVLKPFVRQFADQHHAWLVIAMASTFAGNFTILGSVANLIVVQRARAHNVEIGFGLTSKSARH